jgi:hypothetical protein
MGEGSGGAELILYPLPLIPSRKGRGNVLGEREICMENEKKHL